MFRHRSPVSVIAVSAWLTAFGIASHAQITVVPYSSVASTYSTDIEDVAAEGDFGTTYDSILTSGDFTFGERFAGQSVTSVDTFDILSGTPNNPLTLAAGTTGENLSVVDAPIDFETMETTQVIGGVGSEGPLAFEGVGEGTLAALLPADVLSLGFTVYGSDGGSFSVSFYGRNGSLIQSLVVDMPDEPFIVNYGFQRAGNLMDIAGVVFQTDGDLEGLAFDNFRAGRAVVPAPSALAAFLIGAVPGVAVIIRRRRK